MTFGCAHITHNIPKLTTFAYKIMHDQLRGKKRLTEGKAISGRREEGKEKKCVRFLSV